MRELLLSIPTLAMLGILLFACALAYKVGVWKTRHHYKWRHHTKRYKID